MKLTFLGQGYEPTLDNTIGNHLINILSLPGFHTFTGISAFASESGIIGLAGYIESAKTNFESLNLIVGIDQEGTSKEALQAFLNISIDSLYFINRKHHSFIQKICLN